MKAVQNNAAIESDLPVECLPHTAHKGTVKNLTSKISRWDFVQRESGALAQPEVLFVVPLGQREPM